MIYYDNLESLKFYKEKVFLPHDKNNKQKGRILFSLNTSQSSLSKIISGSHPVFSNVGNIYSTYFYDFYYVRDSVKAPVKLNRIITTQGARNQMRADYDTMVDLCKPTPLRTPLIINSGFRWNLLYDTIATTRLYETHLTDGKLKSINLAKKLDTYFTSLDTLVHRKINDYKSTCILVDLDEYNSHKTKMSHVLHNLLLILRRSERYISRFAKYKLSFLFFTKKGYFLFDMEKDLKKANYSRLQRLVKKLQPLVSVDNDVDKTERAEIKQVLVSTAMAADAKAPVNMFTGQDSVSAKNALEIIDDDSSIVKDIADKVDVEDEEDEDVQNMLSEELSTNEELKRKYADALRVGSTGTKKTDASLRRDKELRERQRSLKVKNQTIEEITAEKTVPVIPVHHVENEMITNERMKDLKFTEFNRTYNKELYARDIMNAITCMNNKSIPVHIVDVKIEDTSDELTLKETYTFTLEDEKRRRHTLKFNLPTIIDDEFIMVNGSKKNMQMQIFAKPVVKTAEDEVQICTNYNKMFINRYGKELSRNSTKFRKLMQKTDVVKYHQGCNTEINKKYLTTMEYDEFAKSYNTITIGKATFDFNCERLEAKFDGKYHSSLDDGYLVGYETKGKDTVEPIWYRPPYASMDDLITVMVSYADEATLKEFKSYTTGKKFIHTEAMVMRQHIPVVVIISYFEGLSMVIRKFNHPKITFTDKKSNQDGYQYIQFKDGYLCYPISDIEACLMFNGLTEFPTAAYTIADMDDRVTYLDIFEYICGKGLSMSDALLNYYDFMIDPITLEILKLLDYPEDLVSLIIFANNMLADNSYTDDIDLNNYRLRKTEIIPAILYKNIATAYSRYRRTSNNPNPQKISMDENKVIKDIMALTTVEDYPELSPMVELHKRAIASMKGASGMNEERAYKIEKRAFHNSMIGVFALSTDPGPNTGEIRQLTSEPTLINARGFMELNNRRNSEALTDMNLSNPVEMLTPMSSTHDDPNRVAMSTKQTCHAIPVEGNCPVLVSTGMDQMVHHRTGNDFSVVAKEDGKVIVLDTDTGVMIVEYKSGERQAIDLSPRVAKNGGGGFYLMNQQVPRLKNGETFKKDTILSYDPRYYKEQGIFGNRVTMGALIKVMVASNYATYEDSAFVTKYMSEITATNISMPHQVVIGKNATVEYLVKVGDSVVIGDDIVRFDTSYDDAELNRLLAGVRDDMKEEIVGLGKTAKHSHYTGKVTEIVIEPTVPNEELSPSLKKIVSEYQSAIKKKKKLLDQYDPEGKGKPYRMGMLMRKTDGIVKRDEYGKVRGRDVEDGVIITIYVTYHDEVSDGDKLASFTANKNTTGYQIPKGFEPYALSRPYEEISSVIAPSAVLQRGTPSVITTACANKVLIELKRKMYEVLTGENFDEILKQKQPYMLHDFVAASESTDALPMIEEKDMEILESAYDLQYIENDHQKGYQSSRIYQDGDMILPVSATNCNMSPMIERFTLVEEGYNAIMYDDFIKAVTTITPNTPIRVKL